MSDLFEKLDDNRYMGQDGLPVYKYTAGSLQRAYRTAVDALFLPEYVAPLVVAFAGAASTLIAGNSLTGDALSTFSISFLGGAGATGVANSANFLFQQKLNIHHNYFDKRPNEGSPTEDERILARKIKRSNLKGLLTCTALSSALIAGVGFVPEFAGFVTGLTVPWYVNTRRYKKVENKEWGFYLYTPPSKGGLSKKTASKVSDLKPAALEA